MFRIVAIPPADARRRPEPPRAAFATATAERMDEQAGASKEDQKREYYEEQSHARVEGPLGGLMTFNASYGYLEGMLRGFRSGFLTELEYRQLCQSTSLEDVKLTLGDTDFGAAVSKLGGQVTPDGVVDVCWQKHVTEMRFLREQATGQLGTFLNMMTYEALISNVCFLMSSIVRGSDTRGLLAKCDPIGDFPRLRSVLTFENSADGLVELYRTVLVDTPVAPYFSEYFDSELRSDEPFHELQAAYSEVELDIITNMVTKLWLEDMYRYCSSLGGETAVAMRALLEFEADKRALSITINSFGTALNDQFSRDSERRALYCNFGTLYPEGVESFSKVGDMAQLASALEPYSTYRRLWNRAQSDGTSFLDALYGYEVYINRLAFLGQSHFAAFWAFHRLKLQERRNIHWIVSCVFEQRPAKDFGRWVKTF